MNLRKKAQTLKELEDKKRKTKGNRGTKWIRINENSGSNRLRVDEKEN